MKIRILHVKGHSHNEFNDKAHNLATDTLKAQCAKLGLFKPIDITEDDNDEEMSLSIDRALKDPKAPYLVKNHKLYYIDKNAPVNQKLKLFIPKNKRKDILKVAHDNKLFGGHMGVKKTREKLSDYYWPGIGAYIEKYVPEKLPGLSIFQNT